MGVLEGCHPEADATLDLTWNQKPVMEWAGTELEGQAWRESLLQDLSGVWKKLNYLGFL